MSFINFIKNKAKAAESKDVDTDKIFIRNVAISFVGIIICIVMLSASSYAWFTTTVESNNTITSSVYKLEIAVVQNGEATPLTADINSEGDHIYVLKAGKEYVVTITAASDTTGNTGYIKLRTDKMAESDPFLYSEQIDRGETITFTLAYTADTEITVVEGWGTSSIDEGARDIVNGGIYGDAAIADN